MPLGIEITHAAGMGTHRATSMAITTTAHSRKSSDAQTCLPTRGLRIKTEADPLIH
jgi:hypothetical protein